MMTATFAAILCVISLLAFMFVTITMIKTKASYMAFSLVILLMSMAYWLIRALQLGGF